MNVCVFCGSGLGNNPEYSRVATEVGHRLASAGHTLIYGGGKVGLMGILADAALSAKGRVIGIIPAFLLEREVGHHQLTRIEVVGTMHERKQRMAELSNAIIVLPGGIGTLDETAEMITWRQLDLIKHPIAILNPNDYFNPLLQLLNHMAKEGFLNPTLLSRLIIDPKVDGAFKALSL